MYSVFQLGQSLAKKEFNAAADFCFLAFSLLTGYNCFEEEEEEFCLNNLEINARLTTRKHINLLNASIPDDSLNSCITRFGWSLLDYQATEIFDFALHLGNGNLPTFLSKSKNYIKTRKEYIQLLGELGGFDYSIELYSSSSSFPSPSLNESNKEEKTEKVFVLKHMELPKSVLIDKSYAHPTESYVNREMFTEGSNKELLRNQLCNIQSDEPPILIVNALHGEKYNSETSCEGESMQEVAEVKKKKKQLTQPPTVPLQIQNFVCDNILPPIPLPTEESIELNEVTPQILPPQHSKITSNVSPPSRLRKQSSSSSSTTSNNIIPSKNEQQTTTTKTSTNKNLQVDFLLKRLEDFYQKLHNYKEQIQ
ncbi:Sec16_C domain-containing protein [Meloidogyne graminicola]|uniref:Sec16_C domain-containing protein n=1 Tax=Meloidogyne graminicola TaxID=189291 RepID=A0A8S9ZG66_9BILA|nr:Sec16_C domain-containing protein [Meloidogyne graminicola]